MPARDLGGAVRHAPQLVHSTAEILAIENPATGMLKYFLGKPALEYTPTEYGDNWSKRTALWGHFNTPIKNVLRVQIPRGRSVVDLHSPMSERDRERRTDIRSIASPFFTQAFFEANQ